MGRRCRVSMGFGMLVVRMSSRVFARVLRPLIPRKWTEHHCDATSHEFGGIIGVSVRGEVPRKFCNLLEPDLGVGHFAAPKTKGDFDLHFLAEEIDGVTQLHGHVMRIDLSAELDLFDLVGVLMLFGILFPLRLFVTKLSKVDQAANGRRGIGSHLDEIHPVGSGPAQGVLE